MTIHFRLGRARIVSAAPNRFVRNKLHLGTRQLFAGAKPLGLSLHKKPFAKLIKLVQPKLPSIKLPLES